MVYFVCEGGAPLALWVDARLPAGRVGTCGALVDGRRLDVVVSSGAQAPHLFIHSFIHFFTHNFRLPTL
ncbi:MAG: hypothetical protein AAGG75_05430, partial [Bacteroidota bacterium]